MRPFKCLTECPVLKTLWPLPPGGGSEAGTPPQKISVPCCFGLFHLHYDTEILVHSDRQPWRTGKERMRDVEALAYFLGLENQLLVMPRPLVWLLMPFWDFSGDTQVGVSGDGFLLRARSDADCCCGCWIAKECGNRRIALYSSYSSPHDHTPQ
jgi:hypothetical protein